MAHFEDNESGLAYEQRYCTRCVHREGEISCPIMAMHVLYSSKPDDKTCPVHIILDSLIPVNEQGEIGECSMFLSDEYDRY